MASAHVASTGVLQAQEQKRYALRLGSDVFAHGTVSPAKQKALIDVFLDIRERLREGGVRTYRSVATSALRDAKNGQSVVRNVYQRSGISLQIIAGSQESKLSRAALLRSVGGAEPETLLLDLGGGSLEIERAGDGSRRGRSLPIGSVRLLEAFPQMAEPVAAGAFSDLRKLVGAHVRQSLRASRPAPTAIGTGGALDTLAHLLPLGGACVPMVDLAKLLPLTKQVAALSAQERQRQLAVRPDRADLMLPAMLIILELVEIFNMQRLVVPGTGLRDALLHNLLVPSDPGAAVRRLLGDGNDVASIADRGARLGTELFDDLAAVHKLWPPALQPFLTAVYAWYFGALLEPKAAAKHACYVLANVENADLDVRSRALALYAVAAQEGGDSRMMQVLAPHSDADQHAGLVLAGLLRVAICMAPQGRRMTALDVDLLHDPIVISADLSAPLAPELLSPLAAALGRQIVVR